MSLPSMEVYLCAIDCFDMYFPNPALPVVASCGVVPLYHDVDQRLVNNVITISKHGSSLRIFAEFHRFP